MGCWGTPETTGAEHSAWAAEPTPAGLAELICMASGTVCSREFGRQINWLHGVLGKGTDQSAMWPAISVQGRRRIVHEARPKLRSHSVPRYIVTSTRDFAQKPVTRHRKSYNIYTPGYIRNRPFSSFCSWPGMCSLAVISFYPFQLSRLKNQIHRRAFHDVVPRLPSPVSVPASHRTASVYYSLNRVYAYAYTGSGL